MFVGGLQSGKTHTLMTLAQQIEGQHRLWAAYGPVEACALFTPAFYETLSEWLVSEGYILNASSRTVRPPTSLTDYWRDIFPHIDRRLLRHFVILIDQADASAVGLERLGELLSTVRGFQEEWHEIDLAVHFVWAGTFIPARLLEIFRQPDSASWPLQRGGSLLWLPDLDADELLLWLQTVSHSAPQLIHARYLRELTAGDPATTKALLSYLNDAVIRCSDLAQAAEQVIRDERWAEYIAAALTQLSLSAREKIVALLQGYFVHIQPHGNLEDELLLSGLVRLDEQPFSRVLRLKNWVIEAALRYRARRFSPFLGDGIFQNHIELIPPTYCLNQEIYALLSEIETQLRNLVRIRLGDRQDPHPLQGLNSEEHPYTGELSDQYQRAIKWRNRVQDSRWVHTQASLISYTDTTELLGLIEHLLTQGDPVVSRLRDMRASLQGFKAIRDAVMHGQIVTEDSLDKLVEIRRELNNWLTI
jgi:hypothetical protein